MSESSKKKKKRKTYFNMYIAPSLMFCSCTEEYMGERCDHLNIIYFTCKHSFHT